MGCKGTEAANKAAEIVLLDDNFASIAAAVREGRTVYDNPKKSIAFLLPILAGSVLPITPLQTLSVNMVSLVTLAMGAGLRADRAGRDAPPPR